MQCLFSVSCIDYAGLFVVAREREVLTCVNIQSNELLRTKKVNATLCRTQSIAQHELVADQKQLPM